MKISRPTAQISSFLLFLFVPLLNIFRIDLVELRFFIFGKSFAFSDGFVLLLCVLLIVFLFVGISKWFGRQFCGWLCPHNTFSVLYYKLTHSNFFKKRPLLKKSLDVCLPLLVAPIISFSALAYFVDPSILVKQILALQWNSWAFGAYVLFAVFFYIMISRLRIRFCRNACPYGIFQMTFGDKESKLRGVKNMVHGAGLFLSIIVICLIGLLSFSLFSTTGYAAIIEKQIEGAPTGDYLTYTYVLKVQNNHHKDRLCEIYYDGIPSSWEVELPERIEIGANQSQENTLVFRVDPSGMNQFHDIHITLKDEDGSVVNKRLIIYPVE